MNIHLYPHTCVRACVCVCVCVCVCMCDCSRQCMTDLRAALGCGVLPLPVQVGSCSVGSQMATYAAIRIHIGHLQHVQMI